MVKVNWALVVLTSGADQLTRFQSYKHLLMSFSTFFITPEWISRNRSRERHSENEMFWLNFWSILKWMVVSESGSRRNAIVNGRISTRSFDQISYLKCGRYVGMPHKGHLKDRRFHFIGPSNLDPTLSSIQWRSISLETGERVLIKVYS